MLGVIVNVIGVIAGSIVGCLLKKGLPDRVANVMTTAVALAVIYIGIDGMLSGENTLVLVLSLVIGALVGTLLDLDGKLERMANRLETKVKGNDSNGTLATGFVSATLLFCVGAMAIVGSLQSGLSGDHEMLFTKALLDFISSIVLASTLGLGVMLSAVSILIYQGAIALLAQFAAPFLSDYIIAEMTCAGSVLILALALNMLGLTKIKLLNFIPGIFIPIGLCMVM